MYVGWYAPDSHHPDRVFFFSVINALARMPDFQGAMGLRKICRIFLLHGGGRKVTGEGCNRASLCHSFTECPPLHYIYMYAVVSDRVAPGERPFPAPPRAQPETQKAVPSAKDPTPPE